MLNTVNATKWLPPVYQDKVNSSGSNTLGEIPNHLQCIRTTPWTIKGGHFYFYDNFGKCRPISIILSLLYSAMNHKRERNIFYHLTSNLLPHYLVKCKCSTLQCQTHFARIINYAQGQTLILVFDHKLALILAYLFLACWRHFVQQFIIYLIK